jgi:hypothetical protein
MTIYCLTVYSRAKWPFGWLTSEIFKPLALWRLQKGYHFRASTREGKVFTAIAFRLMKNTGRTALKHWIL